MQLPVGYSRLVAFRNKNCKVKKKVKKRSVKPDFRKAFPFFKQFLVLYFETDLLFSLKKFPKLYTS